MTQQNILFWFRQDLRLKDNPALFEATSQGLVLPIYILDDVHAKEGAPGAASRWWLHHALHALNEALSGCLSVYRGDPGKILPEIIQRCQIQAVYWNRCYEPWQIKRDTKIKKMLPSLGVSGQSDNASLLWEPWQIQKADGTPYKVFTPFFKKGCLQAQAPRKPLAKPVDLQLIKDHHAMAIDDLALLTGHPWEKTLVPHWQISESGAAQQLTSFLKYGLAGYKTGRDFPAKSHVSRLSPFLHFGQISPHQVWHAACQQQGKVDDDSVAHFCSELGWREFSYHLLYHFPQLPWQNLQAKFNAFPWKKNAKYLRAWQQGKTGYPIVDAGMRQLWQTGYMHNRVRMIVGSFLVKNLLIHWHEGERWFWDTLVDADLANNSASWQWIAGCGADAAPYFRIFNPITQGEKFDAKGEYIRKYVPELARLPDQYLFFPTQAPEHVLKEAGVVLGKNYPKPIVDLQASRKRALAALASTK